MAFHRQLRHWALAGLAALALPALAINNGIPTTAFGSVGIFGVQVAPDWVLTAHHTGFNVGDTFTNAFGTRTVAARYDAPGASFPANDLTLLRLVSAETAAPYVSIYGLFIPDGPFTPMNATIVSGLNSGPARGYGFTTISESQVFVDPDDDGPELPVRANYLVSHDSQVYVTGGDSGGGLFFGHALDTGILMGITSAQYTDPNNVPNGSGFVQLAAYRSWIDSTMDADTADDQTLRWVNPSRSSVRSPWGRDVTAVPEPATWLMFAAGAAVLAGRRRQRNA